MVRMVKITATPAMVISVRLSMDEKNTNILRTMKMAMMIEQTHNMASRFRKVATLFIFAKWTLGDQVAPGQVLVVMMIVMTLIIMLMYMVIITMRIETMMSTGLHLIALMGKNLPVLFSSEVMVKKGLLQITRWSLVKIPFFLYSSSHMSSSLPSWH